MEFISSVEPFSKLPSVSLKKLISIIEIEEIPQDENAQTQGKSSEKLFIVVNGAFEVSTKSHPSTNTANIIKILTPPAVFGIEDIFTLSKTFTTVKALNSTCKVLSMTKIVNPKINSEPNKKLKRRRIGYSNSLCKYKIKRKKFFIKIPRSKKSIIKEFKKINNN